MATAARRAVHCLQPSPAGPWRSLSISDTLHCYPYCRYSTPLHVFSHRSPKSSAPSRSLTSSSTHLKKAAPSTRAHSQPEKASVGGTVDPFDFSELQTGIDKAHAKLREDLSKLRGGGKLSPEAVESLRVKVDKGSSTERVADLAQVVPRGRTLQIIAGEREYVRPITSAIQSSGLNLTPQPDQQNPQQLNIQLPSPTTESRKEAVQAAQKIAEIATTAIRNARGAHQKTLRAIQNSKSGRPDDVKKAGERMEKVVEAGSAEVKKIVDAAKKKLEGG